MDSTFHLSDFFHVPTYDIWIDPRHVLPLNMSEGTPAPLPLFRPPVCPLVCPLVAEFLREKKDEEGCCGTSFNPGRSSPHPLASGAFLGSLTQQSTPPRRSSDPETDTETTNFPLLGAPCHGDTAVGRFGPSDIWNWASCEHFLLS